MRVIELARSAGVSADAVRYYARVGLLSPKRNTANGYREFSTVDVKRLWFIKRAQSLGFSLAEIETIIRQAKQHKSPCPMARDIIQKHLEQTGEELEQLIVLRERMKKAARRWKRLPDRVPDGSEICRLIELDGFESPVE
jgi:MerR family Zn(II)-responsive transcriptional regulator of zntA